METLPSKTRVLETITETLCEFWKVFPPLADLDFDEVQKLGDEVLEFMKENDNPNMRGVVLVKINNLGRRLVEEGE